VRLQTATGIAPDLESCYVCSTHEDILLVALGLAICARESWIASPVFFALPVTSRVVSRTLTSNGQPSLDIIGNNSQPLKLHALGLQKPYFR